MTARTDLAWRYFATDGVAASGVQEPDKAEIRDALNYINNERQPITGSSTVTTAMAGKTLALSNSFELIFAAASNYHKGHANWIVNESATRAQLLTLTGLGSYWLYPGQSARAFVSGGQWRLFKGRWKAPSGQLDFYTNFSTGAAGSDGLNLASPMKSINSVLQRIVADIDFEGAGQTVIVVNVASGVNDSEAIDFAPHNLLGAQGGAAVRIKGTGGEGIIVSGADCVTLRYGAVVQIEDLNIGTTNNGISLLDGAKLYLSGVKFTGAGGAGILLQNGSHAEQYGICSVQGNFDYAIRASTRSSFLSSGLTVTGDVNVAGAFVGADTGGLLAFNGATITNTHTVVGSRYSASRCGVIVSGNGSSTYFPGNSPGTTATGGQYA